MIFLDTSYLLALELSRDSNHALVQKHWKGFLLQPELLVTTTLVFLESVTFLNNRGHHGKAEKLGERLRTSAMIEMVPWSPSLFEESWTFFRKHKDKKYSLADCFSFILMREKGLTRAFALDRHFSQAGFTCEP